MSEPTQKAEQTPQQSGSNSFGFGGFIAPNVLPLALALLSVLLTWVFVQFTRIPSDWMPFVFGILCLALILRMKFAVYFAIGLMLMHEVGRAQPTGVNLDDVLFVLFALGYIVFSFRYADMRICLGDLVEFKPKKVVPSKNRMHWRMLRPFRAGWHWALIAIFMAFCMLQLIGHDRNSISQYGITPNGLRAITMLWLLATVWFVVDTVSRLMTRYRGSSMRSRVFARSVFCRELKHEFYSIERKRAKLRAKSKLASADGSENQTR